MESNHKEVFSLLRQAYEVTLFFFQRFYSDINFRDLRHKLKISLKNIYFSKNFKRNFKEPLAFSNKKIHPNYFNKIFNDIILPVWSLH